MQQVDRILRDTQSKVEVTLVNSSGVAVDVDGGQQLRVTIRDSAGTVLVNDQVATDEAGTGNYSYTLSTAQTVLMDIYEATWTGPVGGQSQSVRTRFEIVGGFIVSLQEVRDFDPELLDTVEYTAAEIRSAREWAEEYVEQICRVSFRPRGRRVRLSGSGSAQLFLPDYLPLSLVSGSIDAGAGAVALTAPQVADVTLYDEGIAERRTLGYWSTGERNVSLHYTHGYDEAPEPIRIAVLELVRKRLVPSAIPSDAESFSTEGGALLRMNTPGRGRPTGVPLVDATIEQYKRHRPAIA